MNPISWLLEKHRAWAMARHVAFRNRYPHPWVFAYPCSCSCECPYTSSYPAYCGIRCVNCAAADFGGLIAPSRRFTHA